MEDLGEVGVLAHPVAAAADVDDMAVMRQAIDERSGHDLVAQDLAPLLEAFIGGQHSGCALIAPVDELEEEHGAGLADRQVADLVDDQERRIGEDLEAASQLAGGLGFFERGDEVGQSAVVDSAPALSRGRARLIARCVLPTPGGPRKITFSLRSKKSSSWSESICSRSIEGWNLKAAVVAQRDLGTEELLDGLRGRHASAIDPGEDVVDGLQRTGHLEIGELGSSP